MDRPSLPKSFRLSLHKEMVRLHSASLEDLGGGGGIVQITINLEPPFFICRGETFRREFAELGELRSFIPENVNVMAMLHSQQEDVFLKLYTCYRTLDQ